MPSRWDARGLRGRRSALYLVGGGTTYNLHGKLRNWLVGDFVDQFPESSAIVHWNDMGTTEPAFAATRSLAPMVTRSAGLARLTRSRVDPSAVRRLVREMASRLDDRLTADDVDAISTSAAYWASSAPHVEAAFSRVLDRVDPRVVIMEDASYGGRSALVALMKSRGILVVEPQHGWIGPTHGAYNFGAAMRSPELVVTLPDELLTFGEYWSEGIRHPGVTTPIGKPHLETMSASAPDWRNRARELLLVSSVAGPEETTGFAIALRSALPPDWVVRFRPHPIERPSVASRYATMLGIPGIELDDKLDVYESLAQARGVVGVASTVLFEGLAMGCQVFVRNSQYADFYVGDLFGPTLNGEADVVRVVESLTEGRVQLDDGAVAGIWKPHAVENFREWAKTRNISG